MENTHYNSGIDTVQRFKNDTDILNEVNGIRSTGLNSMEIGKIYLVKDIKRKHTDYGLKIVVECDGVEFVLPDSWKDRMSSYHIKALMQSEEPLYVVYNGKIQLPNDKFKHDIKFTRN